MEEIFTSHWKAIACLKLGSPQLVRCCPAMICLPLWVYEDYLRREAYRNFLTGQENIFITKKNQQEKLALKLGCSNVHTMTTGLDGLLKISDARKTAIIDDELLRLKVDIATLP